MDDNEYAELKKKINRLWMDTYGDSKAVFTMSVTGSAGATDVATCLATAIDSYLEACFVPDRGDDYVRNGKRIDCRVSLQSLPVLCRRLLELETETAETLVLVILTALGDKE